MSRRADPDWLHATPLEIDGAELPANCYFMNHPEMVPGDGSRRDALCIDANLGVPWIPESDIRSFAAELFGVPESNISGGHLKQDAVWSLDAGYAAERSVAASSDYGTPRITGVALLGLALNLQNPAIYDPAPATPTSGSSTPRRRSPPRRSGGPSKDRFNAWVFADPDRTERPVRLDNDAFNNLRPRRFDGSRLGFPGMSRAVTLNPRQADAVRWGRFPREDRRRQHAAGPRGGGRGDLHDGRRIPRTERGTKPRRAGLVPRAAAGFR